MAKTTLKSQEDVKISEEWSRAGSYSMYRFGVGRIKDEWDNIRGSVEAGRAGVH